MTLLTNKTTVLLFLFIFKSFGHVHTFLIHVRFMCKCGVVTDDVKVPACSHDPSFKSEIVREDFPIFKNNLEQVGIFMRWNWLLWRQRKYSFWSHGALTHLYVDKNDKVRIYFNQFSCKGKKERFCYSVRTWGSFLLFSKCNSSGLRWRR